MATAIEQLKEHLGVIEDINTAGSVLGWDQQTYMPPGGGSRRAEVMGTLSGLSHSKFASDETARLLDAAEKDVAGLPEDSDDACLVRCVRRDYEKQKKLPDAFVAAWTEDGILSNEVWRVARGNNDYAAYKPYLAKMVNYARQQADYYGFENDPYDALLDDYEPGMKTADVVRVFEVLRREQVPLVKAISEKPKPRTDFLTREYPEEGQGAFALKVVTAFGYDLHRGRLDVAPHPFETSFGTGDVRITTRYDRNFPQQAIFAIFHEAGHGMYEQNIAPSLARTPLASGVSCMFHESQSRLWENVVGRSRGLWQRFFPDLKATFPDALADVTANDFYRAVNKVESELIRVEADEVTYNMHIMLRFDLERDMLNGTLTVDDLPEAWNAKMQEYLGIMPKDDRDGVMQDTHWSTGSIGYFPTYALGNVLAAQIFHSAVKAHPQIPSEIAEGRFDTMLGWLSENVYQHGRKYLPADLAVKVNGEPLNAAPYIAYLKIKYGALYGL